MYSQCPYYDSMRYVTYFTASAQEIRAARNQNSKILRAILQPPQPRSRHPLGIISNPANFFATTCRTLRTPLIVAIKTQLPDNVTILLYHGADPNRYLLGTLIDYAQNFVRFQRRGRQIRASRISQAIPITAPSAEKPQQADSQLFLDCILSRP